MAKRGKTGSVGFSRKWLGSELAKVERERVKERRQEVAKLRKALKEQMRAARLACRDSIRQALEQADQSFKQDVTALRTARRAKKGQLRGRCQVGTILGRLEQARSDAAASVALEPYALPA